MATKGRGGGGETPDHCHHDGDEVGGGYNLDDENGEDGEDDGWVATRGRGGGGETPDHHFEEDDEDDGGYDEDDEEYDQDDADSDDDMFIVQV